jgi:hypothetical protein
MKPFIVAAVVSAGFTAAIGVPAAYASGYNRMSPLSCIGAGSPYIVYLGYPWALWQNEQTGAESGQEVDCPIPDTDARPKSTVATLCYVSPR